MAWGKQAKRTYITIDAEFHVHPLGAKMELSRCVEDGELYVRFFPPKDEHGKGGKPVSMSLNNWERQVEWADFIDTGCQRARKSEASIKLLEIHKKQAEEDFVKLNGARSAFPSLFTDEKYAEESAKIKAKYPDVYGVKESPIKARVTPSGEDESEE